MSGGAGDASIPRKAVRLRAQRTTRTPQRFSAEARARETGRPGMCGTAEGYVWAMGALSERMRWEPENEEKRDSRTPHTAMLAWGGGCLLHIPALHLVGIGQALPLRAEHLALLRDGVLLASGLATAKKLSLAERTRFRAPVRARGGMCGGRREREEGIAQVKRAFHSARLSAQNAMYGLFFFLPIADLGAISAQATGQGGTQRTLAPSKRLGRGEGIKTVFVGKRWLPKRECVLAKQSRPARASTGVSWAHLAPRTCASERGVG